MCNILHLERLFPNTLLVLRHKDWYSQAPATEIYTRRTKDAVMLVAEHCLTHPEVLSSDH